MISCLCVRFSLVCVCVWVIAPSVMTHARSHVLQSEHFSIWPEDSHCGAQHCCSKFTKAFSILSCLISDSSCESPVEFEYVNVIFYFTYFCSLAPKRLNNENKRPQFQNWISLSTKAPNTWKSRVATLLVAGDIKRTNSATQLSLLSLLIGYSYFAWKFAIFIANFLLFIVEETCNTTKYKYPNIIYH